MKALIVGISTAVGRRLAEKMLNQGYDVLGLDVRSWPDVPEGIEITRADIRRRSAEEVFRTGRPDTVIYIASAARSSQDYDRRYRVNLESTRAVFEYSNNYNAKQVVFVSNHMVYGAAPDTSMYCSEDDPPFGGLTFPRLNDLFMADLYASQALWRYPDLDIILLRMVYTLGPSRRGVLSRFLKGPGVPTVLGFDPLFQFMHEDDHTRAIMTAMEAELHGVYNIAGPQPLPLSALIDRAGKIAIPIPQRWYPSFLERFGYSRIFANSINHIKYSVIIDDKKFRQATGFMHQHDENQTLKAFRYGV
ncbi:MAG: NAD-dependent epimerase/dehydratase family protein [Firmicutes bacterium]|jgi:UDP-glucose 4-epimerase|nr:NAD-dependent epimerase/dehydratase family protein [Bacillota bacterium]